MDSSYPPPDVVITISSATDLKNINWKNGHLRPYVVAWIDQQLKVTTKIYEGGGSKSSWNEILVLPVTTSIHDAVLTIEIYNENAPDVVGKPVIGSTTLRLQEIADAGGFDEKQIRKLTLVRPSGRPQGTIKMAVRLRDKRCFPPSAYTNYGPPPVPHSNPNTDSTLQTTFTQHTTPPPAASPLPPLTYLAHYTSANGFPQNSCYPPALSAPYSRPGNGKADPTQQQPNVQKKWAKLKGMKGRWMGVLAEQMDRLKSGKSRERKVFD